jgi:hypothetical protein
MDANTLITLRAVHVMAGAFWVGAALMLVAFVAPTARAVGPAGAPFMQRLLGRSRFGEAMGVAGLAATLAGLALLWPASGGLNPAWIASPGGATMLLASLAGVAALAIGIGVNKPSAARLAALGDAVAAAGGPTPAQAAELARLQRRLRLGGQWGAALLVLATLGMAVASHV